MQRGYVGIEIESLTVAWVVKKFYHFLYGCHFILETDQEPLEAILSRSLNQATPWLQHVLIRTLPYHFTVRYIPGLKNLLADCLLRLGNQEDTIKLPKLHVYQISHQLLARSNSLQEIRQATQADDKPALLKHTIMMGWPNNIKEIPQVLHPYWTFHKELTIEDGRILKGTRIVIPNKKHEAILKQIHDSHLELTKCKLHTKQAVYWPGLNDQLEQLILNCQLCLKYSRWKKKSDTYSTLGQEVLIFPWMKLATDLFHFEGHSYLLTVDYTSWFPVMRKLTSMMAHHIANHIKQIFAEYGSPDTLISDNGPCYASKAFKGLMAEYHINHIMSSPHYPQSNGLAKKYVQVVKNLFHKAKEEGQDLYKCLMTYRNTPLSSTLQSLIQILSNRATRSTLPLSNAAKHKMGLYSKHFRMNKKNQHLPTHDLCLDQAVMYQDATTKKWYPAKITKLCDEPRSYIISTEDGTQYRKTQKHLKLYQLRAQIAVKELPTSCNNNHMQLRSRNSLKPPKRFQMNYNTDFNKRNQVTNSKSKSKALSNKTLGQKCQSCTLSDGKHAYFHEKNTFLYDSAIGHWPADCSIRAIQMAHHKLSASSAAHLVVQMTITQYSKAANADNLYMYRRKEIA